ncbi:MAG TPA: glycogen debranching enzyme N-terminal domain-containing protein, partial [Planctomycetaceae bacterium]|nr:glycogen debranching enzyme N-terminal domain-containing protein [Planctomycetaceae bacterium]
MTHAPLSHAEWLETDGLGGFAMGTVSGARTRRYHGLLVSALTPPSGRVVLVSGFDAWLETPAGRFALSTQCYRGDVRYPDGESRLDTFLWEPWPTWRWRLPDGTCVEQELFMPHGCSAVCLRWTVIAGTAARLLIRPLLAARDYHCLQHETSDFRCEAEITSITEVTSAGRREESRVAWRPYERLPAIVSWSNGGYQHEPAWYRQFLYSHEAERGLDCLEDLASPGVLSWDLSHPLSARAGYTQDAVWLLSPKTHEGAARSTCDQPLTAIVQSLREREKQRRGQFPNWCDRSADQFIVRRGSGQTIIAGYPWFTDWGRDTFIALRGLCLATGRLDVAESILLAWAGTVSEGMLPNRFPDHGESPEFNSVDASLWFVIAVQEFLAVATQASGGRRPPDDHDVHSTFV